MTICEEREQPVVEIFRAAFCAAIESSVRQWDDAENETNFDDLLIAEIRFRLPSLAAVLDGTHVIVPRNPTDTMLKAAGNEAAMTIYTLMIEAAQEPKA